MAQQPKYMLSPVELTIMEYFAEKFCKTVVSPFNLNYSKEWVMVGDEVYNVQISIHGKHDNPYLKIMAMIRDGCDYKHGNTTTMLNWNSPSIDLYLHYQPVIEISPKFFSMMRNEPEKRPIIQADQESLNSFRTRWVNLNLE